MYKDTITLFIKDGSGDDISWYATVLTNVDVNMDKAANIAKTGLESADSVNLHVRHTLVDGVIYIGGEKYLTPKAWAPGEGVTFKTGDFFVIGEVSGIDASEGIYDSTYQTRVNGGFYDYMNKTYDGVFMITTVSGAYTVIPHFEIGGK